MKGRIYFWLYLSCSVGWAACLVYSLCVGNPGWVVALNASCTVVYGVGAALVGRS